MEWIVYWSYTFGHQVAASSNAAMGLPLGSEMAKLAAKSLT